jgi:hypothetical protein
MTLISKGVELAADLVEPVFDDWTKDLMDSEVLKEIPFIGSAVKLAVLGKTITDRIFLKKVNKFLTSLDPALGAKTRKFGEELRSGDKDAERTAEVLLLALDAIDDLEKAPILAAVFSAFLLGEIDKAQFRRMTAAVRAGMSDDLLALASGSDNIELVDSLRHTGLTGDRPGDSGRFWPAESLVDAVTLLGEKFIGVMARFGHLSKK